MAYEKYPYWWIIGTKAGDAVTLAHRSQEIKFGNGYGQNIADGPNAETKQLPFEFTGQVNEKYTNPKDVYKFLRMHFITPFEYTAPDGEVGLYIATPESVTYNQVSPLVGTVTATLKTAVGFVS